MNNNMQFNCVCTMTKKRSTKETFLPFRNLTLTSKNEKYILIHNLKANLICALQR